MVASDESQGTRGTEFGRPGVGERALAAGNARVMVHTMTLAEVKAMPIGQKFQVMEVLWQDLREKFEAAPVSDEIKALLDERRERVARGEARLLDWDQVKSALGRG